MKKRILSVIGVLVLAFSITACGSKTDDTNVSDAPASVDEGNEDNGAADSESVVYTTDDYSITYNTKDFEQLDVRGDVHFSYCNEEVQAEGSNLIIVTKDEGSTVDEIMNIIIEGRGASMDDVNDVVIGSQEIPGKSFVETSDSPAGEGLTLVDSVILVQCGDDVISLELIRTYGSDDEKEMTIEGAFTATFESFVLNR